MRVLLVGINSKYIHTNLAIRDIFEYAKDKTDCDLQMVEFTINNRLPTIVDELFRMQADVILFSCYIWNVNFVESIAKTLKKISPKIKIIVGGPEVSFHSYKFMKNHIDVDVIIKGEGEDVFPLLINSLGTSLEGIAGIVYREGTEIFENEDAPCFDMGKLPFPYADLGTLKDRILYFESSRGCPFKCSYCLSSVTGNVRFMPLDKVFSYLFIFLKNNVRQVKFVDRTFNCSKEHSLAIWKFLKENDNGVTNFHFEVSAHLFDRETLDFLKTVRSEQFQLEVGVQSTNPQTIKQINRATDTGKILDICREIDSYKNIHQHLDLIAGLPFEDIRSFEKSFNDVFFIRPQQLQLGFLKVLKGSQMENEADEHGIIYNHSSPFEVLGTKWLSYYDILLLKGVEETVELYYNSGRFLNTINFLLKDVSSPYKFFEQFGQYFTKNEYHLIALSKELTHSILKEFYEKSHVAYTQKHKEIALFDMCLKEKPKKLPDWIDYEWTNGYKDKIIKFFNDKENIKNFLPHYISEQSIKISRLAHIQVFAHDVTDALSFETVTFVLFDYNNRDLLGNARFTKIDL